MLTATPAKQEESMPEDAADFAFTTPLAVVADRFGCPTAQEMAR